MSASLSHWGKLQSIPLFQFLFRSPSMPLKRRMAISDFSIPRVLTISSAYPFLSKTSFYKNITSAAQHLFLLIKGFK